MKLQNLQIIGFFSLPDRSLQEANPEAYASAMRDIPWGLGAGQCAHCGMAITHHVVVRDENGKKHFIGSSCAERVGLDPEQLRYRRSPEEQKAVEVRREAYRQKQQELIEKQKAAEAQHEITKQARAVKFAEVIGILRSQDNSFYASLADQLIDGKLSECQGHYVLKAVFGRKKKADEAAREDLLNRVCSFFPYNDAD